MAIWFTRPEMNAGPMLRARRLAKVMALMGSWEPAPRCGVPPGPPSSCAKAARERHNRSGNSLMDGEYIAWRVTAGAAAHHMVGGQTFLRKPVPDRAPRRTKPTGVELKVYKAFLPSMDV